MNTVVKLYHGNSYHKNVRYRFRFLNLSLRQKLWLEFWYPLVEIDAFLGELSSTVCGVLKRLVLHHLHTLASLALLMAMLADHVQLPNPVLETKATTQLQLQPEVVLKHKESS